MKLQGKTAIVTGAASGIGKEIAFLFAREGAKVAIADLVKRSADDTAAEIRKAGGQAMGVAMDVASEEQVNAGVAAVVQAFGGVDVLVSNAGICPFHSFLDLPADLLQRTMEVNLHGAFYVVQAAANQMKAQGHGGAIVATSSISALVGGAMQTHYTPTKAGVHSLMQSVAIALGPYGIRCNSVMPGAIVTDLNRDDLSQPGKRAYFEKRIPIGRLGQPDDVADCVVFLASDMARYVTGAALLVDGGMFVNLQ